MSIQKHFLYRYSCSDNFLSVFRFLFFIGLIFPVYYSILPKGQFYSFGIFQWLNIRYINPEQFICIKYFVIISAFFSAIGLFTRLFIFLTAVSLFLFVGAIYGYLYSPLNNYLPSDFNLTFLVTMILLFTRNIDHLTIFNFYKKDKVASNDSEFINTRIFIIMAMGLVYLMAFIAKAKADLWWINGAENLKLYFFEFGMFRQSSALVGLSKQDFLMKAAWICLMFFEAFAILGFFIKRFRWAFIIFGIIFHWMTYQLLSIDYISKYIWIYLIFIDWDKLVSGLVKIRTKVFNESN